MPTASAPIRIGYCLSLTGPLAGNSRSARLAHDIWREDINRRGGLLGRPVELVCYDDHADASRVPGIYKRLMDEDNVDLVIGGYGGLYRSGRSPGCDVCSDCYQIRSCYVSRRNRVCSSKHLARRFGATAVEWILSA